MSDATPHLSNIFKSPLRDIVHARLSHGPFLINDHNISAHTVYAPTIEAIDEGAHPIDGLSVDHRQSAGEVLLPAESTGHIERHGAEYDFEELIEQGHIQRRGDGRLRLRIELEDHVEAHFGGFCLVLERERVPVPGVRLLGQDLWREHLGAIVMVSIVAHCLVLAAAFMIPIQSHAINMDQFNTADAFAKVEAVKPTLPDPEESALEENKDAEDGSEGAAAMEETQPERRNRARRHTRVHRPTVKPPKEAGDAGILKQLGMQRAALFASNDIKETTDRLGQGTLYGDKKGVPGASFSPFGARLGDPSGGRDRVSIKGRDIDDLFKDRQRHPGVRDVVLDPKREVAVRGRVMPGPLKTIGNLSPGIIQGRIRSSMARFRYCYETALKANPNLSGRVVVNFTIDSSGRVTRASRVASTISNAGVESCVVNSVSRVRFPSFPEGTVVATYPFIFAPVR